MGLQTLVHSPRLESGRKRLGWRRRGGGGGGGKRPGCHLWPRRIPTSLALPNTQNIPNLSPQAPRLHRTWFWYNPDCYSFHPSLVPPSQFSTVTQTHRLIPPQGLYCLLCLDFIPPDPHTFRHLLCSCVIQSSPPLTGISSPVCLALNIQETSQSWDVQSGNPHPYPDLISSQSSAQRSLLRFTSR